MSPWLLAAVAMLPALVSTLWIVVRHPTSSRLVGMQLASGLVGLIIILFSFASDQPTLVDLALSLAALSLPGSLLFAHFLERWL